MLDQAAVTDLLDPEALIAALPSAMVSLSQGAEQEGSIPIMPLFRFSMR